MTDERPDYPTAGPYGRPIPDAATPYAGAPQPGAPRAGTPDPGTRNSGTRYAASTDPASPQAGTPGVARAGAPSRVYRVREARARLAAAAAAAVSAAAAIPVRGAGPVHPGLTGGAPSDLSDDSTDSLTEGHLRDLLHLSVARVEPDPMALAKLRIAVPRRRAMHRHAWTAAAAVAVTALIMVPTMSGMGDSFDLSGGPAAGGADPTTTDRPTIAPSRTVVSATSRPSGGGLPVGPPATVTPSGTGTPTTDPSAGPSAVAPPVCARGTLMVIDVHAEPADPSGVVYGWFAARNSTGQVCRIGDPGPLTITAATGADPANVPVLAHAAGDPAAGLPLPAQPPADLALQPGAAYRVRFAWAPGRTCAAAPPAPSGTPAAGGQPGAAPAQPAVAVASPAPTGTAPASPSASSTPTVNPSTTPSGPDGTITLAYTPPGDPASTLVLRGGCGGSVYRALPEPVPPAPPGPTSSAH